VWVGRCVRCGRQRDVDPIEERARLHAEEAAREEEAARPTGSHLAEAATAGQPSRAHRGRRRGVLVGSTPTDSVAVRYLHPELEVSMEYAATQGKRTAADVRPLCYPTPSLTHHTS
jgi:hypothetical protein